MAHPDLASDRETSRGSDHGKTPARSPENDDIYRAIRGELQFEMSLINARVNWLVTSQAFLMVPLTMGARGEGLSSSILYPAIPWLGVVICVLVTISVLAAVWRGQQWRRKARQGAYSGDDARTTFDIVLPHSPVIPAMGLIGGLGVPLALVVTWIWLLSAPPGG